MADIDAKAEKNYKYLAFISYRHLSPDAEIAEAVHEELENFKVPRELDPDGKYKEIRVFRDKYELATNDLSESLDSALLNSKYLIVISSKRTKLSEWCVREVELFKKHHSSRNIIPILVEGEPYESFSEPLKNLSSIEVDDKGNETIKSLDLLAADLRPDEVKKTSFIGYEELEKTNKSEFNAHIKAAKKILKNSEIYRIMATILGVNYGDLKQRHKERQMKLKIRLGILAATILTVFGIAMTSMFIRAVNSERNATSQISMMTLKSADQSNKDGDRAYALMLSKEAMSYVNPKMKNYEELNANYKRVLNDALLTDKYSSILSLKTGTTSPFFDISTDGKFIVSTNQKNNAIISLTSNGNQIKEISFEKPITAIKVRNNDNSIFIATSDLKLFQIDSKTFNVKDLGIKTPFGIYQMDFTDDGNFLIAIDKALNIATYSTKDFKMLNHKILDKNIFRIFTLKNNKEYILNTSDGQIDIFDIKTGKLSKTLRKSKDKISYIANSMSKDGKKFAYADDRNIYLYDIESNFENVKKVDIGSYTGNILLSNDGRYLYYTTMNFIDVFDLVNNEHINFIPVGNSGISNLRLNNKGDTLAFSIDDKNSIGFIEKVNEKSTNKKPIVSNGSNFNDHLISFVFSADDKYLVANSQDSTLKVISTENNIANVELDGTIKAISEDRNTVMLIDKNNNLSLYDFSKEKLIKVGTISKDLNTIYNVYAISNDHEYFAFSDIRYKNIKVFDKNGKTVYTTQSDQDKDTFNLTVDIEIFQDKNMLVSLNELGDLKIFNLKTGELIKQLKDKNEQAEKIVYSKDKSLIGINYYSKNATIFNTETGKVVENIDGEIFSIIGEDGKLTTVYGQKNTLLFEYKNGEKQLYATNYDTKGISTRQFNDDFVSLDDRYLLTSVTNMALVVTDIKTGNRVRTLETEGNFNPKGVMSGDSSKIAYEPFEDKTYIADFYNINELEKKADKMLNGRELTETERIELGLKSRVNENE